VQGSTAFGPDKREQGRKTGRLYPGRPEMKPRPEGRSVWADGLLAGVVAGGLSGLPSTLHALLTGRDPLAAARAAGNLLLPADSSPAALLMAGGLTHGAISLGWGCAVAQFLRIAAVRPTSSGPRALVTGAIAGAAIAALDLGLLAHGPTGRRWPLIRALPVGPQILDHIAFGAVAAAVAQRPR